MSDQKRSYAGVGSRETPRHILTAMTNAAAQLSKEGLILRSGGAYGADTAFESGAQKDLMRIYLPWRGYCGNTSPNFNIPDKAFQISAEYHPAWDRLSDTVQKLMARNAQQVLGTYLNDPALFVLCWTFGGNAGGGTGQAIRIALAHDIPVIDLGNTSLEAASEQINSLIQ